jgi:hypothetical protein
MSYYIGATGEYIWEELLENTTSNVIIANNINLDAGPLSDAVQQIITDSAGTALGELIGQTTQVPSALGQSLITLSALGLLAYNKLNRTSVQDVDSMVYSADYSSVLTPAMYDDRVRIRYDNNYFSNAIYYDGATKKGEILTSRINLLPVDSNNIDLYTSTGKIGIGTASPATPLHIYHATDNILRLQTATNGNVSIEFVRGTDIDTYTDYRFINDTGTFKLQYEDDDIGYGATGTNLFTILPDKINLYKDTEVFGNVGIGTTPAKPLHIYNTTSAMIKLQTASGGVPSIEFVRVADDDNLTDYIMGNYTGDFKISQRNLTTTTDRFVIGANGNMGIGSGSLGYRLEVSQGTTGTTGATCFPLKISAGAFTNAGNNTATLIGLGTQGGTTHKCAIGHCRTNSYDTGAIVFLCNSALNSTNVSMTDERMRITSGGNVGIANTTPLGSLHIGNGNIANSDGHIILAKRDGGSSTRMFRIGFNSSFEICLGDTGLNNTLGTWVQSFKINYQAPANSLVVSSNGSVGVGTTPATPLHIYHATANILRLETGTTGTTSIQFTKGTTTDALTDYRLISDTNVFKLQYSNDTLAYGGTGSDLINISTTNIKLFKNTEITGNVGVGTTPDATYKLDVNGASRFTGNVGVGTTPHATYGLDTLGTSRFTGNVGVGTTPHATYKLDTLGTSRYTGNVGINTTPHATYGLDVLGDIRATAFRGDGANITALNEANLVLTTQKIYERFSTTNFAILNDKIDLPPQYSINITAYDSTTLYSPSSDIRLKGKMSVSYDDRRNVYKLVSTETSITNNVAVLKYKAGDKISIKNIADGKNDFIYRQSTNTNIYLKTCLYKRPIGISFNKDTDGLTNFTQVFEWISGATPIVVDYRVQDGSTYPFYNFTNVMTFIVEAGYAYYLMRQWRDENNNYIETFLGDDFNDYLRAFGAGQTFRLESGYSQAGIDYTPRSYTPAELSVGTSQQLGGVKPRARMTIDASGNLDANIPTSADLINNMNTSHFTNNTGTSKIDISSSYVAPNATKLETSRNIAGVGFDGSGNIDIPYANLTSIPTTWGTSQIPDLGAGKITSGTFTTDRIPDLGAGKITSGTFTTDRIPDLAISKITTLQTALDGKAPTSHTHTIANITNLQTTLDGKAPTSHTHAIADITNLQTTLDGKAPTSHTHTIANITNLQTTLDGKAPTSHTHAITDITNLQTTLDGKAPTSHTHTIANITNLQTTLDGKAPTSHTHVIADITNLQTTLGALQPKIISTAGQIIIGNGDGITTTSTGLTWATNTLTATNLTTTTTLTTANLAVSTQATITRLLTAGLDADMFILANNANNNLRFNQVFQALNDQKWILKQKSNNVDYNLFNFRGGKIAVGTQANPAYMLDVVGDINITGDFRKNANIYKPANAVLADTATALATARTIAGTSFNGTANINIDYFALDNKPIILQPTTTNLQLISGYTFAVPGNVRIGSTTIATNVLQVGAGGRLRIANGTTDYSVIGTSDADATNNTRIVIFGNTHATLTGIIQYCATSTGGSHIFYTTNTQIERMTISSSGVNVNNDLGVSGNIGFGVAPSATYKVNVNGDINCSGAFRVNGVAIANSWSAGTPTTNIYYNLGNVGIGTTTTSDFDDNTTFAIPTARLYVRGGDSAGGTCDVVIKGGNVNGNNGKARLWLTGNNGHSSYIQSEHTGNGNSVLTFGTSSGNTLPTERMKINHLGAVGIQNNGYAIPNNFMTSGSLTIGNIDTNYGGGNNWTANTAGLMMECSDNTEIVIHDAGNSLHSFMRYTTNGNFRIGRNMGYGAANLYVSGALIGESWIQGQGAGGVFRIERYDNWVRLRDGGTTHLDFAANQLYAHANFTSPGLYSNSTSAGTSGDFFATGQLVAGLYAVSQTNTDHLVVQQNYSSVGQYSQNTIKVGFGTFTGFHRCYTDDELYNNETDEIIDIFKNKYVGRVVIATGKIKSDFTRKKTKPEPLPEPEPEPEPEIDEMTGLPKMKLNVPMGEQDEWYSEIDKDGITIEDAVPVVRLSRNKKDKRVFGVLGGLRSTNNKNRLIVNSVGEGGICVSNTNGNIENGDYIQSSDLLGYGEKQDDDLLHNYTIGKATIDCNFELDSPYYRCEEIENGVRVAFIACSYHCG